MKATSYLGDGLYMEFDGVQVRLFTFNGIEEANQVFLDTQVLYSFITNLRSLNLIK